MTPIGDMRERVTLQQEVSTPYGAGGRQQTWQDVATVWAQVSPLRGRERVEAAQVQALSPYRVKIRMRANVTSVKRLLWRGKVLEVRSVYNADERQKFLTLDCEESA